MARPPRFDARWQRRRRWSRRVRSLGAFLALAAVLAGAWGASRWASRSGPWDALPARVGLCGDGAGWDACAIDGDTLYLRGDGGDRRVRLAGYDAPEMDGACPAERALAQRARVELAAWLSAAPAALDGGADPPRDRYGRELRRARRSGPDGGTQWLDDHMVAAGLARRDSPARAGGWCD